MYIYCVYACVYRVCLPVCMYLYLYIDIYTYIRTYTGPLKRIFLSPILDFDAIGKVHNVIFGTTLHIRSFYTSILIVLRHDSIARPYVHPVSLFHFHILSFLISFFLSFFHSKLFSFINFDFCINLLIRTLE